MNKDLNKYSKHIKELKESGGTKSCKVELSNSNDDPLEKSNKKINNLLKKM